MSFPDNGYIPGTVFYREGRSPDYSAPSFAYGFGDAFSSNIAGISQSTSLGGSFKSGNAEAYGAGSAGSDGHNFARGIGYANANPTQQLYRTNYPYGYTAYNAPRDSYGDIISSAQTLGNYGSTIAQTNSAPYNYRNAGYGSALASSSGGYGSSATSSSDGSGTAISTAQSRDRYGYHNSVAATQNVGGVSASTAQSTRQQHGGALSRAGSTLIQSPGIQAAHTTVINAAPGYY